MKRLVFSFLLFFIALFIHAQNYYYVGGDYLNIDSNSDRFDGFNLQNAPTVWVYKNSASQMVYPASDLQPLSGKYITLMKFKYSNLGVYTEGEYNAQIKIFISEIDSSYITPSPAGSNNYVWYDVNLNAPHAIMNISVELSNDPEEIQELVLDFSQNPYFYRGGNLFVSLVCSSQMYAESVGYYIYTPSDRKYHSLVWGSDTKEFHQVYVAGNRIANTNSNKHKDLPIVAFGYLNALQTCNTPTSVTLDSASYNSLSVTWTAGGTETEWIVQYKPDTATRWHQIDVTNDSIDITGLSPATAYQVRVKAVCTDNSKSEWTDTAYFTTAAHTAPVVVTLPATDIESGIATLNKTVTQGTETILEEGWYYRKITDTDWQHTTSASITNLTDNTTYEFFAYAKTATYPMVTGNTVRFTIMVSNMYDDKYEVCLYPNPAKDIAIITVDGLTSNASVSIIDIFGKVVGRYNIVKGTCSINADISSLAEGTYMVRIISKDINIIERFVIKR